MTCDSVTEISEFEERSETVGTSPSVRKASWISESTGEILIVALFVNWVESEAVTPVMLAVKGNASDSISFVIFERRLR